MEEGVKKDKIDGEVIKDVAYDEIKWKSMTQRVISSRWGSGNDELLQYFYLCHPTNLSQCKFWYNLFFLLYVWESKSCV